MKIIYNCLMLLTIIVSCNKTEQKPNNRELIKEIDAIKSYKTVYELKTDSVGKVIDTVKINYTKKNKQNKEVYKEHKVFMNGSFSTFKKYYRESGNLFYSSLKSPEYGILSIDEFWESDGNFEKGMSISYRDNIPKDTVKINYNIIYKNGSKFKTIITSEVNNEIVNKTESYYNDKEKVIKDILLTPNNDTTQVTEYKYKSMLLKIKSIYNYDDNTAIHLSYDEKGFPLSENIFGYLNDSLMELRKSNYVTDQDGNILKKNQITYYPDLKREYFVFKSED